MFKKKEVIPFDSVIAVWKEDGRLANGIGILVDGVQTHVSVPVQRDRVFEVLDQILKMHR